tara:strand:- start:256 stop:1131 length:876 start_codon:yes stop_codon:yes gene_type:complete
MTDNEQSVSNLDHEVDPRSDANFFDAMENAVNGGVQDYEEPQTTTEVTPPAGSGSDQVTHAQPMEGSNENVDWEKRYKDSQRGAYQMNEQLKSLKPFIPVLNAMKQDSGLVQHVRDYFEGGGSPAKSVQEKLGLPEDFVYDQQEAVENPDSDSAKVFNAHIDSMVQGRVNDVLGREKQKAQMTQRQIMQKRHEDDFRKRHNMGDEEFAKLVAKAKQHVLTLDDVHYLVNRDEANKNVANATKNDMLGQMKNVRNIPASASGANSQESPKSFEDDVFDALMGSDGDIDNLFG